MGRGSMSSAAVFFDLDGTLLNTLDDLADAMNAALQERGYPPRSVDECRTFIGRGAEDYVRRALPDDVSKPETIAELLPVYRAKYSANWCIKTRPYPGIPELLAELDGRGVPMAVVTNKPGDVASRAVAHFLPGVRFVKVRGAGPDVPLKPDPTGSLAIAGALGLAPRDVLFVGDMETDMATAGNAGMYAVGVCWGFKTASQLMAAGARQLVEHPAEIADLINGDHLGGEAHARQATGHQSVDLPRRRGPAVAS